MDIQTRKGVFNKNQIDIIKYNKVIKIFTK